MTSWITLYPHHYIAERQAFSERYPDFRASETELARENLCFVGEIVFGLNGEILRHPVVLDYPTDTPFKSPSLTPVKAVPDSTDWQAVDALSPGNILRMPPDYRRHQMPDGSLCLVEADSHLEADVISGIDVIRRAKAVFKAIAVGKPFPYRDSEQSELEAHFNRIGDIVLPPAFYDDKLQGRGRFFAFPHIDHIPIKPGYVHQSGFKRSLLVGTNISESTASGVETNALDSIAPATARAFTWLSDERLTFDGMSLDKELREAAFDGFWFDLPAEPAPCQVGHELEQVLADAGLADADAALERLLEEPERPALIGLRYPARDGGKEWLVLRLRPGDEIKTTDFAAAVKDDRRVIRDVAKAADVQALRVHPLTKPKLEVRNSTTLPSDLQKKTVVLFGVGALGGDVADVLAKAGVGHLILVDNDEMRLGNVIRHVSGIPSIGLKKVDAVRHSLWQHNPFLNVRPVFHRIGSDHSILEDVLKEADIAVATVADENVEMVINEAAVRLGKTVVYGRALRGGAAARVFRVRPTVDACKACLVKYRARSSDVPPEMHDIWIDLPQLEGEVVERECGRPVLAGSAVDLRFASDFTARAAIDEMSENQEWNHLIWSRDALQEISPEMSEPYTLVRQRFPPLQSCCVCRLPQTEVIRISGGAYEKMVQLVEKMPDVETGGVLIGFRDEDGVVHVLEATDAGPNAVEERTRFERDHEYCQECVNIAAAKLRTRGQYIGEWHSHCESKPMPSARDIESLTGIAGAANYLTKEPVMLIAGLNPESGKVSTIHGSCFPFGMRCVERKLIVESDPPSNDGGSPFQLDTP